MKSKQTAHFPFPNAADYFFFERIFRRCDLWDQERKGLKEHYSRGDLHTFLDF
jgi:hypothetical protein